MGTVRPVQEEVSKSDFDLWLDEHPSRRRTGLRVSMAEANVLLPTDTRTPMTTSADVPMRGVTTPPQRFQCMDPLTSPRKSWIASIDSLDAYKLEVFQVVRDGKNVFVTREAWTFKSFHLDHMRSARIVLL